MEGRPLQAPDGVNITHLLLKSYDNKWWCEALMRSTTELHSDVARRAASDKIQSKIAES
jgi:hypothetical protein